MYGIIAKTKFCSKQIFEIFSMIFFVASSKYVRYGILVRENNIKF